MALSIDELPNDIAALKRLVMAQAVELAAAKNGLIVTQLTIDKPKAQLA